MKSFDPLPVSVEGIRSALQAAVAAGALGREEAGLSSKPTQSTAGPDWPTVTAIADAVMEELARTLPMYADPQSRARPILELGVRQAVPAGYESGMCEPKGGDGGVAPTQDRVEDLLADVLTGFETCQIPVPGATMLRKRVDAPCSTGQGHVMEGSLGPRTGWIRDPDGPAFQWVARVYYGRLWLARRILGCSDFETVLSAPIEAVPLLIEILSKTIEPPGVGS